MRSDGRLHPLSILFNLGAQFRSFVIPGLFVLVTAGTAGWDWQVWMMALMVPYGVLAIGRYFSYRFRYETSEMVIRTGFVFRNERHIPYARIQNLDAVRNVFHRLLGVVEVRLETGGGQEPEAIMRVLPMAAFEDMRRRVFEGRGRTRAPAVPAATPTDSTGPGRTLLRLPRRELILCGLIQNRGTVVIAAMFGLLWEAGLWDRLADPLFGKEASGRGVVRDVAGALLGKGGLPWGRIAIGLATLAGLLLLIRLLSMGWVLVRLHGFRLARTGEDLRTEFGLLTRVVTTIPLRRIQTLTIRQGPLDRLFGRASVRVETAGGDASQEDSTTQREWLAPIIRRGALAGLVGEVLPGVDFKAVGWRAADPRAFRRALKEWVIVAVAIASPFAAVLKWRTPALLAVLLAWAFLGARRSVAHLGWAVTDDAIFFRSGWIWRQISVAPFARIQSVAIHESPFDRRAVMARVRVDTAGAGNASHRVDIPYLPRGTARDLCDLLATQAARTAFTW